MLLLNDLHIGVKRSGGVTTESLTELHARQVINLERWLEGESKVLILGDLFDSPEIPMNILRDVYFCFDRFLSKGGELILVRGNHDIHKNSTKISSIDFLASLLSHHQDFTYVTEPYQLDEGVGIIPHLTNQDLFDIAVKEASIEWHTVLLHCNYDNFFAAAQDHSLNLSKDQAKLFSSVIIGHEHAHREIDNVFALGCQFPTSISDCLCGSNNLCRLNDDWEVEKTDKIETVDYVEVDWEKSAGVNAEFIRVTGKVDSVKAGEVVRAIANLRRKSKAYVISNAVEVEGLTISDKDMIKSQDISDIDILNLLYARLKDWQVETIKGIL